MGISQSNLSATPLDFVVAVSQESVNSTMFQFMAETSFPVLSQCWTQTNGTGPLVPISLSNLMAGSAAQGGTNGTNPFMVQSWSNASPVTPDITNIDNSNFACGIQMQIGLPPEMNIPGGPNSQYANKLPYLVTLSSTNTNTAIFNLMFAQFTVVYPDFGRRGLDSYTNMSQPNGTSWGIQVSVPLSQLAVAAATAPARVQKALHNLGADAFSIQQLFLDFTNAILTQLPSPSSAWPAVVSNQFTTSMIQTLITQNEQSQGLRQR
jgi:hypothetical protein